MYSTTVPSEAQADPLSEAQRTYLHTHRAIVADLARRLGHAPSYQECVTAIEWVDAHYRRTFAEAFRRAGIPYRL